MARVKQRILLDTTTRDGSELMLIRERQAANKQYFYYVIQLIGEGGAYEADKYSNEAGAWQRAARILKQYGIACEVCGNELKEYDYNNMRYRCLYRDKTSIQCNTCIKKIK